MKLNKFARIYDNRNLKRKKLRIKKQDTRT